MQTSNPDFRDLLSAFNAARVEYLIVGAHSLAVHGHVRATRDLDIWVRPERENARRVIAALGSFGAPLLDLTEKDLSGPGIVFQVGIAPNRVGILSSVEGVEFSDAWATRVQSRLFGENVTVLSRAHLLQNKRAVGRLQDLADIERLESPGGGG